MPEPQAKAQVAEKSTLPKKAVKEDKRLRPANSSPIGGNFASRNWLEWATGAALGAALLGVVFYVTEVRPSSMSAAAREAVPANSESHSAPVAPPTASSAITGGKVRETMGAGARGIRRPQSSNLWSDQFVCGLSSSFCTRQLEDSAT